MLGPRAAHQLPLSEMRGGYLRALSPDTRMRGDLVNDYLRQFLAAAGAGAMVGGVMFLLLKAAT